MPVCLQRFHQHGFLFWREFCKNICFLNRYGQFIFRKSIQLCSCQTTLCWNSDTPANGSCHLFLISCQHLYIHMKTVKLLNCTCGTLLWRIKKCQIPQQNKVMLFLGNKGCSAHCFIGNCNYLHPVFQHFINHSVNILQDIRTCRCFLSTVFYHAALLCNFLNTSLDDPDIFFSRIQ